MGFPLPKSLLKVGDESILERQIRILKGNSLDVVIVVGYRATMVMQAVRAAYVFNSQYFETGSLYSLHLASQMFPLEKSLVMTYADMFISNEVVQCVLDKPDSVAVVKPYDGRGTRLYFEEGVAVRASVATPPDPRGFSFGGVAHLSRPTLDRIPTISKFTELSATFGFIGCQLVLTQGHAVNVNTPGDLEYARSLG